VTRAVRRPALDVLKGAAIVFTPAPGAVPGDVKRRGHALPARAVSPAADDRAEP
jgi:hypothetical protein